MPKQKDGKYLKMSKVKKDPTRPVSKTNYMVGYQAVKVRNKFWYPTPMVAFFMSGGKGSRDKYIRNMYTIADWLSNNRRCSTQNVYRTMSSAFKRLDGNWFTTEEKFNAALKSLGKKPVKFIPFLEKRIILRKLK